jgi:hypothetical protein
LISSSTATPLRRSACPPEALPLDEEFADGEYARAWVATESDAIINVLRTCGGACVADRFEDRRRGESMPSVHRIAM